MLKNSKQISKKRLAQHNLTQARLLLSPSPKTSASLSWLLDGLVFTGCITFLYLIMVML